MEERVVNTSFYDAQFYRIKRGDARGDCDNNNIGALSGKVAQKIPINQVATKSTILKILL